MFGRMAGPLFFAATQLALGCAPNLGDVPFACSRDGSCPDGYSCQSTVCVRDGAKLAAVRPTRATWINPPEMFWFSSPKGGATLLVNDNFSQGRKGIYEIDVGADGTVADTKLLLPQADSGVASSSVVVLPDGRFGIVTLRFPNVDGDEMTLDLFGVERDVAPGTTPGVEKLYSVGTLYLGGFEPPYVSAIADGATLHVAWTVPSDGGRSELLRLERQGSPWIETWKVTAQLPGSIPPLSGDCYIFRDDSGFMTLRGGFENFALAPIDPTMMTATFVETSDEPLFVWQDHELSLRRNSYDEATGIYDAAYVMKQKSTGMETSAPYLIEGITTPFVGIPYGGGALLAPVSADTANPTIGVAWQSPTEPLRIVARIPRESTEPLYTARAFVHENKTYVTWIEFHDSIMDVWVGVADFIQSGAQPLVYKSISPRRIFSFDRSSP